MNAFTAAKGNPIFENIIANVMPITN